MFRFKIHFKMLIFILLLVVLMSFTISASTRAESLSQQAERLYGNNQTIRSDPQPELGLYYPYYLYIPDNTKIDTPVYMLVEPNNSGKMTDDFTIHEQKAKSKHERGYPNQIASRLGIPLLMPVFPTWLLIHVYTCMNLTGTHFWSKKGSCIGLIYNWQW